MNKSLLYLCILLLGFASCKKTGDSEQGAANKTQSGLELAAFDKEVNGKPNKLYTMTNSQGMEVTVINFGARIVSILVPDKNHEMKDVVLGFDNIDSYVNNPSDFGAAIGRYGNRIANGQFELDGVTYTLPKNNGENTLHGGPTGFQYQMFDINQVDTQTLECTYLSADGDNGFPGNLKVTVTYKLTDDNAVDIAYKATTDAATVVNLTNHSYFNLSGNTKQPITDHLLYMNSNRYLPTDEALIPTGEIGQAMDNPMDFSTPRVIGQDINSLFKAVRLGNGYDHNWILNTDGDITQLAAKATCPTSGISLEVYTTEPGVQFYTGNFLDGSLTGKGSIPYAKRTGFCLETQHYPNSPNQATFPSTVLRPGQEYTSRCIYRFCVE
ncbi:galactose mutarotase [Bacteroidales bacterium OttesenSCG-928-J19]|nr:galactose mutarotase [Bacteroidales bacterium OttesenSCG-928-J19]